MAQSIEGITIDKDDRTDKIKLDQIQLHMGQLMAGQKVSKMLTINDCKK